MFMQIDLRKCLGPRFQLLMTAGAQGIRFCDRHRLDLLFGHMFHQRPMAILAWDLDVRPLGNKFNLIVVALATRSETAVNDGDVGLLFQIIAAKMAELAEAFRDQKGARHEKQKEGSGKQEKRAKKMLMMFFAEHRCALKKHKTRAGST